MIQPVVISSGDPSGVGYEIILKAWLKRAAMQLPPFIVLADPVLLKKRADYFSLPVPIKAITPSMMTQTDSASLHVLPLENKTTDHLGTPLSQNAPAIIEAIETGVKLIHSQMASALVTCPIAKKPLYDAGFGFPGHTEFLGALSKSVFDINAKPIMMLAGPELRTVPVTVHIALCEVFSQLTHDLIIETATITHYDLQQRFGIAAPVLAIAGLNPHAGEGGSMGRQEIDILLPAIETLKTKGINAIGPFPSDTMFHAQARKKYDAALCMYHDQALIPVKTIGFDDTVNVTLGLPFIRTSPDHGTAFDIAAEGIASPDSLIAAIQMAAEMAQRHGH